MSGTKRISFVSVGLIAMTWLVYVHSMSACMADEPKLHPAGRLFLERGDLHEPACSRVDGVFRIDRGDGYGTGFAISLLPGEHIYLATSAHVVEGDDGNDLDPAALTAVQRGDGVRYSVRGIFKHPRRVAGNDEGPDVAVIELGIKKGDVRCQTAFRLLPEDDRRPLIAREVGLLGFPHFGPARLLPTDTSFGSGRVSRQDGDRIIYAVTYDHGGSGSPVFFVDEDGRERVVAVHRRQFGHENLREGVFVRALWEIMRDHGISNDVPVPAPSGTQTKTDPKPSHGQDQVVAYRRAQANVVRGVVQSAKQGKLKAAEESLGLLLKDWERSGFPVPWEVHCLRGAVRTYLGYERHDDDRQEANTHYSLAMNDLNRAIRLAPQQSLPYLLYARASNNVGCPVARQKADPEQERLLRSNHDLMKQWLTRPNLSDREKAQCNYLLAFTHQYLGCGGREQVLQDIHESIRLYRSRQNIEFHEQFEFSRRVRSTERDLWDEFDVIVKGWEATTP